MMIPDIAQAFHTPMVYWGVGLMIAVCILVLYLDASIPDDNDHDDLH